MGSDTNTLRGLIEKIAVPLFKYALPRIGKVESTDDKGGRVLVTIPSLGWTTKDTGTWCYPTDKKSMVVPDVGSYVIVEWLEGNPELPIYRGIPTNMKDQIVKSYNNDPKLKILFEHNQNDVIKYEDGDYEVAMSGDVTLKGNNILLGDSASKGVARNGDSTQSSATDDPVFWAWLTAAAAVLAGLGVVAPTPTTLTAKINQGSSKVKAVD